MINSSFSWLISLPCPPHGFGQYPPWHLGIGLAIIFPPTEHDGEDEEDILVQVCELAVFGGRGSQIMNPYLGRGFWAIQCGGTLFTPAPCGGQGFSDAAPHLSPSRGGQDFGTVPSSSLCAPCGGQGFGTTPPPPLFPLLCCDFGTTPPPLFRL